MSLMVEDGENNAVDVDTDTDEWWIDFVAGWISGAVSVVVCQPIDTVLTRLQAGPLLQVQAATTATASTATNTVVRGAGARIGARGGGSELAILATHLISLTRNYGIRSLWKGSSPMIGAVPFQNALLMGGYGFGKRYSESESVFIMPSWPSSANNNNNNSSVLLPIFMGGCIGGIVQSFLMSPIEWIKVNQQTSLMKTTTSNTMSSTSMMLKKFYQHKRSLWNRGLSATLLRDGIPHGVWFVSYEYCKIQMMMMTDMRETSDDRDHNDDNNESSLSASSFSFYQTVTVPIISGAVAATTAWTVGYPFDIIKTRIQATTTTNKSKFTTTTNNILGVYETGRQLIKEANGNIIRGLYRGFTVKLMRAIPASMIGFVTYEYISNEMK
mmetsp:Transcript_49013/g.52918  ORF Transcript_49013/g.52918 Transcript_49013/m.52918 type:complete len:385 (-) Transcript_49013:420-1574(-)